MNLIGDKWIPVIFGEAGAASPKARPVGLRELYEQAEAIRDLALGPPQRVAVMRLLLCITQAALDGPEDEDNWLTCRERIVPESLSYLESRLDRFELFGKQPFLQVPNMEATDNATLDKLDLGLAAGNNATLFDQSACPDGRERPPCWAALQLLTFQCFSPGGTIGATKWNGKDTGRNSEHSPCVESSVLLALLRGPNILSTIHLNLPTKKMLQGQTFGHPAWDRFPDSQKGAVAENIGGSYLGRLVPVARAVLLGDDGKRLTLANGLSYPKLPIVRDSMATVILKGSEQKPAYLSIKLGKHPWRELGGVLAAYNATSVGSPLALRHLVGMREGYCDLWLGGLSADRGKLIDAAEWNFSLPIGLLQTACMGVYGKGVDLANAGEKGLRNAVRGYCEHLKVKEDRNWQPFISRAVPIYWSILDGRHGELIELASAASDLAPWVTVLGNAMRESYRQTCPHTTARQIQAFAIGHRRLHFAHSTTSSESPDSAESPGDET